MPTDNTLSNQIYLSRDQIRSQISDYIKSYLELENVDLTKSSFLSYLIDIVSTLTGNLMFYQTSVYREFFLTTAQLPETIFNLSAFLGYNTQEAQYATANILVTIPLGFPDADTSFTIPEGHKFYAGSIEFVTYYSTSIRIVNNASVMITVTEGNKIYNLPVSVDTTANNQFSFVLPARQYKETIQEFQIDADLQLYQFTTIDVPLDGKVATMIVEVRDPGGSSWRLYTEYESLYLMTSSTYGYVSRRTDDGRKLYFGNGLIGVQPLPGSTVRVTVNETEGADGNVIAGAITSGERIYNVTDAGVTELVNYTVINSSPATNGEDEESIEDIRNNAITSLTALGRLVSEGDYQNADVVIEGSPIAPNSIPVLKRSDVKCNEIELFTILQYNGSIVPTRNAKHQVPITNTYLARGTEITIGGEQFQTLFDLTLDTINLSASYHYIMYEIQQTVALVRSYGSTYNLSASELVVRKSGSNAIFELSYTTTESDYAGCTCELMILETSETFSMTNDAANKKFTYTFADYTDIVEGELTYYFTISSPTETIGRWSASFVFRQNLDQFMLSNILTDSTSITVYDIPVIQKSYYTSINQRTFELQVLQTMLSSMDFVGYRMLTDFTNVKFANTIGTMTNMQHNTVTKADVIDIAPLTVPTSPSLGDRYIVGGHEGGAWTGYEDYYAQCTDATSITWAFVAPVTDDIVYVANKGKKYVYTDSGWVVPDYEIPLQISIDVFRSDAFAGSDVELANSIRTAIVNAFSNRFGCNINLFRSEIIDVIQSVTGVEHCRLITPESNIFFEFNLNDFDQLDLLEYGPEYIYFSTNDIAIRVF